MLSKMKLWLTGLFAGVVGVLYAMLRYQSNRADKANERANIAESKITSAEKRIEAREKRDEIDQDIAMGDIPYIDKRVRDPYNRDESTKL